MEEVHEVVEGEGGRKVVEGEGGGKVEGQGQTDVWDGLTVSGEKLHALWNTWDLRMYLYSLPHRPFVKNY